MTQRLDEKLLPSDFTFGFELEAYVYCKYIKIDKTNDMWEPLVEFFSRTKHNQLLLAPYSIEELKNAKTIEDLIDMNVFDLIDDPAYKEELCRGNNVYEAAKSLLNIEKYFPEGSKWIKIPSKGFTEDGSLNEMSFEWRSPVMTLTPESIAHTITFLKHMKSTGVYTDDSCGFHTHISFNGITDDDAKWIILNLAMDKEEQKKIKELKMYNGDDDYEPISFVDYYAKTDYLTSIKSYFVKEDFNGLSNILDDTKYRNVRIHPQGTLEWRGPRDFLNEDYDDEYIKSFFLSLYDFISWMRKVLDNKTLGNYDRDNLMNLINSADPANSKIFGDNKSCIKLIDRIEKNPNIITKLGNVSSSVLYKLCREIFYKSGERDYYSKMVLDLIYEGKKIPNMIFALFLLYAVGSYAKEAIKSIHQPLPVKEIEYVYKKYGSSDLAYLHFMECMSKDDILQIINNTSYDADTFIEDFAYHYAVSFDKSTCPVIFVNAMAKKFDKNTNEIRKLLSKYLTKI